MKRIVYTSLGAGAGAALCYPTQDRRSLPTSIPVPSGKQCSGSTCLGLPDPDPLVRGMDPDPPSQWYGSGSGSGSESFYHQALIIRKTLIPTFF